MNRSDRGEARGGWRVSVSVGSSVTSGARCRGVGGGGWTWGGGVSGTRRRVVIATERSLTTVVIAAYVTVITDRE